MPSITEHFGLTAAPFASPLDDGDLWLPSSRQAVLDALLTGVGDRVKIAVLVGEQGVGKTCVLRALRHRLPEAGHRLTYCHNATLGRRDFYRQLCHAIGLQSKATAAAVFHALTLHVEQMARERVHPVFLVDEAHLLHQDTLDHLHILTNYGWDSQPLLTLVLVGLPELWDRLALRRNRSLWSRVHCRLSIGDASPRDTVEYVRHRLVAVGCERELFSSDALALIHEASAGRLRDVDRLAAAALYLAAERGVGVVDRGVVNGVIDRHHGRP